jgi:lysophospholipase L1-like esterase
VRFHDCSSRYGALLLALVCSMIYACGGSPTTPTGGGTNPTNPPTITCPPPVTAHSTNGAPIPVTYTDPVVAGGQPPLTVACLPVSGATYSLGTKTVNCSVADAQQRSQSCSFTVTVDQPVAPKLGVTTFLAFGDSITEGEIPDSTDTPTSFGRFQPFVVHRDLAYPNVLQGLLAQRYYTQATTLTVTNDGLVGETTTNGLQRLTADLPKYKPDVLLLLEGLNDLDGTPAAQQKAIANLQSMIQMAQRRGTRVMISTLLPQNPPGQCGGCRSTTTTAAWIQPFNTALLQMADSAHVAVVDMHASMQADIADWISPLDGEHPTAAGYQEMALVFEQHIQTAFEVSAASSPSRTGWSATPAAAGQGSRTAAPARPAVRGSAGPSRGKSR